MIAETQHSLFDETVKTFDAEISEPTPADGLTFIEKWLNRLDEVSDDATDDIADTLERLRAEIDIPHRTGPVNTMQIAGLLEELIDQTRNIDASDETDTEQLELPQLINTLEKLRQLALKRIE